MAEHNELGIRGEELALKYLIDKGFTILETNWRFGKEEIDIIALNSEYLIIVEVKTRSSRLFGDPAEFVSRQKQRLLIKATQVYAEKYRIQQDVRFDIISILLNSQKTEITHIENAFYPLL
ncbi:MAG TPA: YraN family protein [Lentimicrobium sp.]|nr:YraN family protein [Lentimicrobium sp.]